MTIRNFYQNTINNGISSWHDTKLESIKVFAEEVMGENSHSHIPATIAIKISLKGTLTEAQKNILLRAAENCPVKNIINVEKIVVRSELTE
jgi:uncharacterized OsmC-like protein